MSKRFLLPAIACIVLLTAWSAAFAQPPSRGDDPGVPGFGPTNALADVKKQLGASDEAWKVIGPKLQKVIAARQEMASEGRGPVGGFAFGPGGRPGSSFEFPGTGPGGFGPFPGGPDKFAPPQPGQILPGFLQDALRLTADQKKQLEEVQKDIDAKLAKILTDDQQKQLKDMRNRFGPGFGPSGPPGAPPTGPTAPLKEEEPAPGANKSTPPPSGNPRPAGPVAGPLVDPMGNSAVSQALADLKTVLSHPKHTADKVQELVAAVRKARQKAREDLEAAQKELAQTLTAEQQAVLVSLGYLD